MLQTKTILIACVATILFTTTALAEQKNDSASGPAAVQEELYRRGYSAGFADAINLVRRRNLAVESRAGAAYVSEYTRFNPYAAENRPHVSMPAAVSASRPRTDLRGRNDYDNYVSYPGLADYRQSWRDDMPPRGRRYAPGDFRDEQGGIYGNRGVLMWTDRYDAGDYANKYWNTHRDAVYAGSRVWDWNNGDQ